MVPLKGRIAGAPVSNVVVTALLVVATLLAVLPSTGCTAAEDTEDSRAAIDTALVADGAVMDHPYQLAPLTRHSRFPRFSAQQLAAAGYPDHMHAFLWPDWQPLVTAAGDTFGPGALCRYREIKPQPGLVAEPGNLRYNNLHLLCNVGYKPGDLMPFLELLDWAKHQLDDLFGVAYDHTLTMVSPDNTPHYREVSGVGTWRLYTLDGDSSIVQPVPVLFARTLVGHAAFLLMTEWSLRGVFGDELPPWLVQGLAEYLAEDGVHLNNYMEQFRREGPVLLPPPLVDHVLSSAPDPDLEIDRKHYRQACYSAFLMVWELIEEQGGLEPLRRFFDELQGGADGDAACRAAYGVSLAELTIRLDATTRPEPIGEAVQSRRPHKPPPTYEPLREVYDRYE